jgi:plasmid replication initiation protein
MKNNIKEYQKLNPLIQIKAKSQLKQKDLQLYSLCLREIFLQVRQEKIRDNSIVISFSRIRKSIKSKNKRIKESFRRLTSTTIETRNQYGWSIASLLSQVDYVNFNSQEKYYKITFPNIIIDNMKKNHQLEKTKKYKQMISYTILDFEIVKNLTSKYTIILYQLARRYNNFTERKILKKYTRKEFYQYWNITGKSYKKNFGLIKKKIIQKAVEEVNQKTGFQISVEYRKTGKSISHIIFKYEKREETNYTISEREKKKIQEQQKMRENNLKKYKKYKEKLSEKEKKNQANDLTYMSDLF